MNKILTKNPAWLDLKVEVEEYLKNNENNFLELFNWLKLFFIIVLEIFFYNNILKIENNFLMFINSLGLGFCIIELGFLSHCITHNSYFKNKKLNNKLSFLWDIFVGFSNESWKYKHNSLHHIYTNIKDKDEDIDSGSIFIFSSYQEKYWFHKYQWLYAPFFYSLQYLNMISVYNIRFFTMKKRSFTEIMLFLFIKISFFSFILYPLSIKNTELSFIYLITVFIFSGIYLSAVVVIPAHLFDGTKMKKEENEHDFFISQVESTSNYSTNIILNELFFGLNYQLEHHLFPQIHYYYYPKINHIVKKHIEKNGLIYHEHKTFFQAIMSHIRFLKKMGN